MFKGYIGNRDIIRQLAISIKAAKSRNRNLPHTLLAGHAGCGKTTLAKLAAKEMGTNFIEISPEGLKSSSNTMELLESLSDDGYNKRGEVVGETSPDIIFLDEIHQLPLKGQEALGIAMEYWQISSAVKNRRGRPVTVKQWVPKFTLIGATTESGMLSKPFRDKFGLVFSIQTYTIAELERVALAHAQLRGFGLTGRAAGDIAKRSRGIPRYVVKYLNNGEEIAVLQQKRVIDHSMMMAAFNTLNIDEIGLTKLDLKIMKVLYEAEEKVGVEHLSVLTGESKKTLIQDIEPYLLQKGFVQRSPGGRIITDRGIDYLAKRQLIPQDKATIKRVISMEE